MSKRVIQTCHCKPLSAPILILVHIVSYEPTRCDPPKFLESPITVLKCLLTSFTSREREAAAACQRYIKNGMGYLAEQTTKPQTLGFSLADSPVGLLAWIYEKLVAWTDAYPWTDDEGAIFYHHLLYS